METNSQNNGCKNLTRQEAIVSPTDLGEYGRLTFHHFLPISSLKGEVVGSLLVVHRKQAKELISILMESVYYFDLSPRDRLGLIRTLMATMVGPD